MLGCVALAAALARGSEPPAVQRPASAAFAPLPATVPSPADNPSTPEKVTLGRLLFWDPILSGSRDIACATCHHPSFGYTDGRDLPIGTGGTGVGPARAFRSGTTPLVKRNSQTILNVAFNGIDASGHVDPAQAPMFWDVRSRGLEAQALVPIESLEEMRGGGSVEGHGVAGAVARVAAIAQYRTLFASAFGGRDAVSALNLSRAIAAYERSLVTLDTPFDRFMRGDRQAITEVELRGMDAFENHGCTLCHNGPMFSDYKLHVLGVPDNSKLGDYDPGAEHRYAFRTPTLRNLAFTAPYMHSGLITSLGAAVGFYKTVGGGAPLLMHFDTPVTIDGRRVLGSPVGRDQLDPLLRGVTVNSELDDIVAFLGTLNGTFDRTTPSRVPSGLRPGGR
ncbi:MAG TPA: cytochrome c peroxidase [Vicinamibacterales bacterium]|jgi:cytochrome c peroxidase